MSTVVTRPVHSRMRCVLFWIHFAPARSPLVSRSDTILEMAVGRPAEEITSRKEYTEYGMPYRLMPSEEIRLVSHTR